MTIPSCGNVKTNVPVQVLRGEAAAQRYQKWISDPPISAMLPVRFPKGARLDYYNARCANCQGVIPSDYVRGTHNWQAQNVLAVDALGHCPSCSVNTPFQNRIREENDGLYLEWRHPEHGWVKDRLHMGLSDIITTLFKRWFRIGKR